ncbi:MAG: hypothetical protein AAFX79_03765 [Planctomycetota bacterium]
MKLNKERRVYVALLGCAGLVLGVDQLLSAGPQSAQAGAPVPMHDATTGDAGAGAAARPLDERKAMAGWNEAARALMAQKNESGGVPDPFAMPDAGAGEAVASAGGSFASRHTLSAVLAAGPDSVAIIDGRPVRIGEKIDGMTLVEVERRAAVFESGARRIRVELPDQATAPGRRGVSVGAPRR